MDLVDVVHDRRHQLAGGVSLEEFGALLEHLIEDGIAQPGDAGKSGVAHQIVARVIANTLDEERQQQRRRDHGPRATAERNEAVQIELVVAQEGMGQQRDSALGSIGDEDPIEDRLNEQRHGALRGAGERHEHHGNQNLRPVLAAVRRQTQKLIHAGTRRRCSAPST